MANDIKARDSADQVAPLRPLYLEDLAVGQEFTSRSYPLDEAAIIAFARQYDPQPFHIDPEAAKDTFFQGLAASGWQTMAITMRLLTESLPIGSGLIGAGAEIGWPQPTRPGDALHTVARVLEITPSRSKPDRGFVTVHTQTLNQRGEVLQNVTTRILTFRRPA
ncbi:MaoC family dehydratase [Paracoccus aminophilus]|uniref:MaoC-like dehydratase n=1 Tax=Paracoccus aminophilus JCM 7686 TaxID=1367847 RepID=S5XU00_PARAH|nr:MaoC family dehydratase [Paracoccus aminophilus]AGT10989.1 MaoC-like dehydratase [Paracoccus aminophilus JCM 7686]